MSAVSQQSAPCDGTKGHWEWLNGKRALVCDLCGRNDFAGWSPDRFGPGNLPTHEPPPTR